jgi:hypothetical protein
MTRDNLRRFVAAVALATAAQAFAPATHAAAPTLAPGAAGAAVAWLEANSTLRASPGAKAPQVRLVSDPGAYHPGARYGAYANGVVYLASWLPPDQAQAVLVHELAHWLQAPGCTGARELQAHTLTARWMARSGRPGPRIPWDKIRGAARACKRS